MNNSKSQHITPDQAATLYAKVADPKTKWEFLDGVVTLCNEHPLRSQREVVDMIGDTATFIAMHGHHQDGSEAGKKAKSKLKSIRDELSVVKVWSPKDRVDGVSFEAHKVLNRLGASAGRKILTTLVNEMGGPGNVTKSAVVKRLKQADPDHKPQANGKTPTSSSSGGNQMVTTNVNDFEAIDLAIALANKLTVGDLSKDANLASAVEKVADIFEAFAKRKQAKSKATATAAKSKTQAPARKRAAATKTPAKPRRSTPKVKTPNVKTPASK